MIWFEEAVFWFLRRFGHVRRLEAEVAEKIRMQDQLAEMRGHLDWLRELATEAQTNERLAYQMLVNFETQGKVGVCPFPNAPKLPPAAVDRLAREPVDIPSTRGYDMVAKARRRFLELAHEGTAVDG